MRNHPWKTLPGGTGAACFFIPVLRVREPLRIWLLPGSLLTRDDSGERFLSGRSGSPSASLMVARGPPRGGRRLAAGTRDARTTCQPAVPSFVACGRKPTRPHNRPNRRVQNGSFNRNKPDKPAPSAAIGIRDDRENFLETRSNRKALFGWPVGEKPVHKSSNWIRSKDV